MPELNGGNHTKDISDGYHTFGELYEWRHALFMLALRFNTGEPNGIVLRSYAHKAWWTRNHHPENDPMFEIEGEPGILVGLELPRTSVQFHMPARFISIIQDYAVHVPHGPYYDGINNPKDTLTRLMRFVAGEDE